MNLHWFASGLIASILYGLCAVSFKYLIEARYLNGAASWTLIGLGLGIACMGWIGTRLWVPGAGESTLGVASVALPIGVANGFATLLILMALRNPATNISQLVPVYNTNTLVAFLLAIVLFREFPIGADLFRNLAGALMIVLGTILIGIK